MKIQPLVCLKTAFLCLILFATDAAAQTRQFRISSAFGMLDRQDLTFSPFVHTGNSSLNLGLRYERKKAFVQSWSIELAQFQNRHQATFDYTLPLAPQEILHSADHAFTFFDFSYALGKSLKKQGNTCWQIGGAVSSDLDLMQYNHARTSNFGYFIAFDLSVWGNWSWQIAPRHKMDARLQAPMIAWIARSPYGINDDAFIQHTASHRSLKTLANFIADGAWSMTDRYQRLQLDFNYAFSINRRWQIGASFRGNWMRHDDPAPIRSMQHQLALQCALNF